MVFLDWRLYFSVVLYVYFSFNQGHPWGAGADTISEFSENEFLYFLKSFKPYFLFENAYFFEKKYRNFNVSSRSVD